MKWQKNPNDKILAKKYQIFYNNNNIEELNQQNIENDEEDYKYLLNRT